jgi:phosphate transport system substrate-binding protein
MAGVALAQACAAHADPPGAVDGALPLYVPEAVAFPAGAPFVTTSGAIRIVGYNDMRELFETLTKRFAATHPGFRFDLQLTGTRAAPPALAWETSALAPMGAEFTPLQLVNFRAVTAGAEPLGFRVAHASLDPRALSGPLGVFVHADNPLRSITLPQLAKIYSGDPARWSDLGIAGDRADQPIHPYGLDPDTPLALCFGDRVAGALPYGGGVVHFHQSRDVIARVGGDPLGIGFAAAMRATPSVRLLALAPRSGEAALLPTQESIRSGQYPLDRYLMIYARRPLTPFAREFLRLVLSREGQQAVAETPQHYLPLSAEQATRERALLSGQDR